jgi:hypothetical protein
MESVVADQQSHGMLRAVSILLRFVIGKRVFPVVEFVISDAIFKGMRSNTGRDQCGACTRRVAGVASVLIIELVCLVGFDRVIRG